MKRHFLELVAGMSLVCALSSPASAQLASDRSSMPEAALPVAVEEEVTAQPTPPPDFELIGGSDPVLARYAEVPVSPSQAFCLAESEEAVIATKTVVLELFGPRCFRLPREEMLAMKAEERAVERAILQAAAEQEAENASQEADPDQGVNDEGFGDAGDGNGEPTDSGSEPKGLGLGGGGSAPARGGIVKSDGPSSEAYPAGATIESGTVELVEGDTLVVLTRSGTRTFTGPTTVTFGSNRQMRTSAMRRTRGTRRGTTRGAGANRRRGTSRPVLYRVRSASASILKTFPRGSVVKRSTRICLKTSEQVSIAGNNGQRVTYTGPGCMRRDARPTRDNIGGFTFG